MTLKELIERAKIDVNAKIDAYNAITGELNTLREADGFDVEQESAIKVRQAAAKAEVEKAQERQAGYEAELVDDERIQRMQANVTPLPRQSEGEEREVRVGVNEKRTYNRDSDKRGQQFLTDVAASHLGSWDARERLSAHMREEQGVRGAEFKERAATGTSAFAGFVVPQYLVDMNVGQATARRPFADICTHHDLPATGMTAYLSKITTATSVAIQTEGSAVSETNIDDTLITINVQTAAGSQTLTRQAIERGIGTEEVTIADLMKRHATLIDSTLLNQATNGLTNVATSVAYTDGTPTAAELYPKILAGVSGAEGIFLNDAEVDFVVMHPRRWRWLSSQMTSTWPFINGSRVAPENGASTTGVGYDRGVRGYLPDGTAVVTDANIATNLGAGTNEDEVYAVASAELHLWEDPSAPMFIRAEQTSAKSLGIDLVLYSYFAYYLNRYTGGHAKIAGTGLVTPTF